jgi:hypothetical protein
MESKNVPVFDPDEETASTGPQRKMLSSEFAELRAQAAKIAQQDFHLGNFLTTLLHHLGHAHGLDATTEDAKAAEQSAQEGENDAN